MADKPNTNPRPKEIFQRTTALVSEHRKLLESVYLSASIDSALLEMQRKQAGVADKDVTAAATNHFKIQGALEFIDIFRNLAETRELTKPTPPTYELKH